MVNIFPYALLGLCCLSFLFISNSQSSPPPQPSSWQPHDLILFLLDKLSYPLLLRKPLDTYQKREIKSKIVLGLDICGSRIEGLRLTGVCL